MNTQEETKASEANSEEEYEDDFNEIVEKDNSFIKLCKTLNFF